VFLLLKAGARSFWLHLADGLDSFEYSSRKTNPLFRMAGWGAQLLNLIASGEAGRVFTWKSFLGRYPFFSTGLDPRANAYLLLEIVRNCGADMLKRVSFREKFEGFSPGLSKDLGKMKRRGADGPYVHTLDLDPLFSDFLRFSPKIRMCDRETALEVKDAVDRAVEEFILRVKNLS
jgi:hypothetical protein